MNSTRTLAPAGVPLALGLPGTPGLLAPLGAHALITGWLLFAWGAWRAGARI